MKPQKQVFRKYIVEGQIFNSLAELARVAGITYSAAYKRKQRGFSDKEILQGKKVYDTIQEYKEPVHGKEVTINGKKYVSIMHAYKTLHPNIPYNTIKQRIIDYGWSDEDAFNIEVRKIRNTVLEKKKEVILIDGISYSSALSAWEQIGKTSFSTYQGRKRKGLPLEICLGFTPLPKPERYEINGEIFSTIEEIAAKYRLTKGQITNRVLTMTLEEALQYIPIKNGQYNKARFKEDPELAKASAILYFIEVEQADGTLFKIGITQRPVKQRFRDFKIKIIAQFFGELQDLFDIEQNILTEFEKNHYRGDEEFDGKTETFIFLQSEVDEVLHFIHEQTKIIGTFE